ncbi:MAG: ADP-ribosylglycohydrolase family protein [Clostridia bacterium]|nr:ADP-ribosylglycohydrolase family protein [Clostridia bacterium]
MLGAIIGDIVGSRFEFIENRNKKFSFFHKHCKFTDDSVMTIAVALALIRCKDLNNVQELKKDATKHMVFLGRKYPNRGYGTIFQQWLFDENKPYNSFGNGAAMRVSPVGFVCETEQQVKKVSRAITEISHAHPEAIKGAEATAVAVFLARKAWLKNDIKVKITNEYYPALAQMTCDNIREDYFFDSSCQGTVPQALTCFFESTDFEDTIRNAISLGGDSDTLAAIAGGVAEAYYGIPSCIKETALRFLDKDILKYLAEISTAQFKA